MKRLICFVTLLSFIGINTQLLAQKSGEDIFKANCTACHTIGSGKILGPDLKGVAEKRSDEWLKSFITNSQAMVESGDADAVALFEEFNKVIMPPPPISEAEVDAVIGYLKGEGQSANEGTEEEAEEEIVGPADAENGEALFLGMTALINGGPSCISCHHIDYKEVIAGGALAKDLTTSVGRLTEIGVQSFMLNPPLEPMTSAYKANAMTKQEVIDVSAFLVQVDKGALAAAHTDYGQTLLFAGLIAATLLMVLFSLLWMKRRRGSVNLRIFERQVKST